MREIGMFLFSITLMIAREMHMYSLCKCFSEAFWHFLKERGFHSGFHELKPILYFFQCLFSKIPFIALLQDFLGSMMEKADMQQNGSVSWTIIGGKYFHSLLGKGRGLVSLCDMLYCGAQDFFVPKVKTHFQVALLNWIGRYFIEYMTQHHVSAKGTGKTISFWTQGKNVIWRQNGEI